MSSSERPLLPRGFDPTAPIERHQWPHRPSEEVALSQPMSPPPVDLLSADAPRSVRSLPLERVSIRCKRHTTDPATSSSSEPHRPSSTDLAAWSSQAWPGVLGGLPIPP